LSPAPPRAGPGRRSSPRHGSGLTARAALLVGLLAATPSIAAAQLPQGATVLVLPFENPGGQGRVLWLREGLASLLSEALDAAEFEVVGRDDRVAAFERLQLPVAATLSRASTIKVGLAVGATAVVVGRIELVADDLVVTARVIRLDDGRLMPDVVERGVIAEAFPIARRLAGQLAGTEHVAQWQPPPSVAAFELYMKGLVADTPVAERGFLEEALKFAPTYDAVRLALWQFHTEQGEHQRAFDVVSAMRTGSHLEREGRFAAAMSLIRLKRDEEAFGVLRTLQSSAPLAVVANAIGVVQLRRGAAPQSGRATYFFNQATELDPANADYFFNLGYAYWAEKDPQAAAYWLREAVRRDPTDGDAHFILSAALQQTGAAAEAARERELALRLSSRYAQWEARAVGGGDAVPRGLERLQERLDAPSARVDTVIGASGQRDQAALAAFHLEAARRAFERESDREAEQELRRAIYLSPYLAEAHLLLGRLHLRAGREEAAVQALKIAIWSEPSAEAHAVLGEAYLALEDTAAARAELARALALDPRSPDAARLRARLPAL
jgi:tetratricopeptide (TPR) repeat protein/TolB-like protein